MSDSTMATFLQEHPRLMGVLFALTLLLTQAGTVAAGGNGSTIA